MYRRILSRWLICCWLCFVCAIMSIGFAQQTAFYDKPEVLYRDALELFAKAKYGTASKQFSRVMAQSAQDNWHLYSESHYYKSVCGLKLYNRNADIDMRRFIETYPESNRITQARMALAEYLYHYKRYNEAYTEYSEIDREELAPEQQNDYLFHLGYSSFQVKKYQEAKLALAPLTEEETKYRVVATYYYAYILYTEGKYQSALNEFEKIENDPSFAGIVPYYVLQIHYMQEQYAEVVNVGPELLATASPKRAPEVSRLIGEAYYHLGEYDKALPYMNMYVVRSAHTPDQDGCYILGYIYYKKGVYDTAANQFLRAVTINPKNELAQSSFYHLAYCYVNMNEKKFAMDAFRDASRLDFNTLLKEDAMYNYVKLAYDLGLAPYKESISVFEQFLAEYPNSVYRNKVYEYMLQVYMKTKNYAEALQSLDKIRPLTSALLEAKQILLFNRGFEQYQMQKYNDAVESFVQSMGVGASEDLLDKACFWAGESSYKAGMADSAYTWLNSFVSRPQATKLPEYSLGFYNLGYVQLDKMLYSDAQKSFDKFLQFKKAADSVYEKDALLRAGDAAFMQRSFKKAEEYYDRVIKSRQEPLDYAFYQHALSMGARGLYQNKIDGLLKLVQNYPRTEYMVATLNELAATYLVVENNSKALLYYKRIQDNYPRSNMARLAMLKIGMIYFNMGNSEKALESFQMVVGKFPNSAEARQALVSIRNIYITLNKVDEFFAYTKTLPNAQIEVGEQDSITYMAAESRYMDGDCEAATEGLNKYVQRFPQGFFIMQAWFYLGECSENAGLDTVAENAYVKVASMPYGEFTEKAVRKAAALSFKNGHYDNALNLYKQMLSLQVPGMENEALLGRMRCYYLLNQDNNTLEAALSYIRRENILPQSEQEARYYIAKVAVKMGDESLARQMYTELINSTDPRLQAEARYYMIEKRIAYGELSAAEKLIFDYISDAPSDDYYLAKVYMLWADIYEQRGNILQAKQTLQSIIEHYDGEDEIRQLAKQKYEAIEAVERAEIELEERERAERYSEESEIVIPEM